MRFRPGDSLHASATRLVRDRTRTRTLTYRTLTRPPYEYEYNKYEYEDSRPTQGETTRWLG